MGELGWSVRVERLAERAPRQRVPAADGEGVVVALARGVGPDPDAVSAGAHGNVEARHEVARGVVIADPSVVRGLDRHHEIAVPGDVEADRARGRDVELEVGRAPDVAAAARVAPVGGIASAGDPGEALRARADFDEARGIGALGERQRHRKAELVGEREEADDRDGRQHQRDDHRGPTGGALDLRGARVLLGLVGQRRRGEGRGRRRGSTSAEGATPTGSPP